jgi:hypothetical protein
MPNQKTPKTFVDPQQVFDVERQAHFDAQKKQAEAMTDVAAQNLARDQDSCSQREEEEGS